MVERVVGVSGIAESAISDGGILWMRLQVSEGQTDEALAIGMAGDAAAIVIERLLWAGIGAKVAAGQKINGRAPVHGQGGRGAVATPVRSGRWDNGRHIGVDFAFGTITLTLLLEPRDAQGLVALLQEVLGTAAPPAGRA